MTARLLPLSAQPNAVYAVMTAEPLGPEGLIAPPAPELLRRFGTSARSLERLESRRHQLLLLRSSSVDDAAFAQRDLRIEALTLAEQHDGVVIDLGIPRVVEDRPGDVSLAHATQWYVVDYDRLDIGELRTVGLIPFGLPEIVVVGVGRTGHPMFSAVLAGLVHRIIAEWPANDPVGRATVTLRDIAYGLSAAGAADTPADRAIAVRIDYDPDRGELLVHLDGDPAVQIFA
jgi:hypothetical protein